MKILVDRLTAEPEELRATFAPAWLGGEPGGEAEEGAARLVVSAFRRRISTRPMI